MISSHKRDWANSGRSTRKGVMLEKAILYQRMANKKIIQHEASTSRSGSNYMHPTKEIDKNYGGWSPPKRVMLERPSNIEAIPLKGTIQHRSKHQSKRNLTLKKISETKIKENWEDKSWSQTRCYIDIWFPDKNQWWRCIDLNQYLKSKTKT